MPILTEEPRSFPDDLLLGGGDLEDRQWSVAYTKVRQEKSLARDLHQRSIPHYLPLIPKRHVYRGRTVNSHLPLFSSYVFLYTTDEERIRSLSTNRVASIVPVRDQGLLLTDLQRVERLIEASMPLTVESRLRAGQPVRVKCGALAGMEGKILKRCRTTRLLVAIEFLQQGVSLEIDDHLLEPI